MTFERADHERKGHITKEEYVKMNAHFVSEEQATAMFNAIDTDSKGKVIFKLLMYRILVIH